MEVELGVELKKLDVEVLEELLVETSVPKGLSRVLNIDVPCSLRAELL